MFDIGFSELILIGVVALVVIGPERLPRTARTLGLLFGRLQRYVNEVKADINREMELDELRRLRKEVQGAAQDLQQSVTRAAAEVESGVRGVEQQLNEAGRAATADTTAAPAAAQATAQATASAAAPATPQVAAESGQSEPPHQPSLPGFEKI